MTRPNITLNFLCLNSDLLNSMDLSFLGEGNNYIILRKNISIKNEDELVKNYAVEFLHYPLKEYVYEILNDTCHVQFDEVCILCRDVNVDVFYFAEIIKFAFVKNKACVFKLIDAKNNFRILTAWEINKICKKPFIPFINTFYASAHSIFFLMQFLFLLFLSPSLRIFDFIKREIFKVPVKVCIAKRVHSNQSYIVAKALKELGVKVLSVDLLSHEFGYDKCDVSLDISGFNPVVRFFVLDFYFLKSIFSSDVFLFENNGESFFVTPLWKNDWFLPLWFQKAELILLKISGKKVIFEMRDCSVYRRKDKLNENERNICKECSLVRIKGICANKLYIEAKRTALKYADFIFCSTPELKESLPDGTMWLPNGYIFKSQKSIKINHTSNSSKIKIIHASTSRPMKGTDVAITVVAMLKKKYNIDFVLIEKMSNVETKEHIKTADIVLGQLNCGVYGNFEIESMAEGKPVICYVQPRFYADRIPPFFCLNSDDIVSSVYAACEKLINDVALRNNYARRSYEYAKDVHDYKKIGVKVKRVIENIQGSKK